MGDSERAAGGGGEESGACFITDPITGDQVCRVVTRAACQSVGGIFRGGPCAPALKKEPPAINDGGVSEEMVARSRMVASYGLWLKRIGPGAEANAAALDYYALLDVLKEADEIKYAFYKLSPDDPFSSEALASVEQISQGLARLIDYLPRFKETWDAVILEKCRRIRRAQEE